MNAFEGLVADDRLRDSTSWDSKGISQSPEQSPEGQREAPRAEQLPSQLAPSPQVVSSTVLFTWQQVTVADSLSEEKTLSKKSIELVFRPPDNQSMNICKGKLLPMMNLTILISLVRNIDRPLRKGTQATSTKFQARGNLCGECFRTWTGFGALSNTLMSPFDRRCKEL